MKTTGIVLALVSAWLCAPVAQAVPVTFTAELTPEAAGATGSGLVTVVFDADADSLSIDANWSGLSGTTTVAHIHCCTAFAGTGTAGVAVTAPTLPGFPVGVSAGSYTNAIDLSASASYLAAFLTNFGGGTVAGAEAALFAGLNNGTAYFNIHTTAHPGGEIRGFLRAVPVPEPLTSALMALGLLGTALTRRRKPG